MTKLKDIHNSFAPTTLKEAKEVVRKYLIEDMKDETLTVEIPLDDEFSNNLEVFRMLFPDFTDDEIIKLAFSLGVRSIMEEQKKFSGNPKSLKYCIAEYDANNLIYEYEVTKPEIIDYFKNQGTYIELTDEHISTLGSQFGLSLLKETPTNIFAFEISADVIANGFECAPYFHENKEAGIKIYRYGTPEDGLFIEICEDNGTTGWTLTIDSQVVRDVTITEEVVGMKWITLSNYQVISGGGVTWEDAIIDFKRSLYANAECFAIHARKNATIIMEDENYTGYNDEYPGLFAAGYSKEEFERDYELAAQQWFIASKALKSFHE